MSSEIKVTVVEAFEIEQYDEDDGFSFTHPSKYYFVNGLEQYVYVHTRNRQVIVDYIKEHYDGKYTVRTAKESKGSGEYTCNGSNSRKGFASHLKKSV